MMIEINPTELANLLWNAHAISNEPKGVEPWDHVLLAYEPGTPAYLYSYGMGRHSAGRARQELNMNPPEAASVCITRDEAKALQSQLRGLSSARGAKVTLKISPEGEEVTLFDEDGEPDFVEANLILQYGDDLIAALPDSDPEANGDTFWDNIDNAIADARRDKPVLGMTFAVATLKRLNDIKPPQLVVDLAPTGRGRVVAAKVGPDFEALLGSVDRDLFAAGGEGGDGPGTPEHLIDHPKETP